MEKLSFFCWREAKIQKHSKIIFFLIIDLHKHKFCQAFYHTLVNTIKSL